MLTKYRWPLYITTLMVMLLGATSVYQFLEPFSGPYISLISALAFDATPLAIVLSRPKKNRVKDTLWIAIYSAAITAIYGSLSGFFKLRPEYLEMKPMWLDVIMALLHGVLIPILGLAVTWYLFHSSADENEVGESEKAPEPTTRELMEMVVRVLQQPATNSPKMLPAPSSSNRIEWPENIEELLSYKSNKQIAEILNCGVPAVRRLRRKKGIPAPIGGDVNNDFLAGINEPSQRDDDAER